MWATGSWLGSLTLFALAQAEPLASSTTLGLLCRPGTLRPTESASLEPSKGLLFRQLCVSCSCDLTLLSFRGRSQVSCTPLLCQAWGPGTQYVAYKSHLRLWLTFRILSAPAFCSFHVYIQVLGTANLFLDAPANRTSSLAGNKGSV